MTESNSAEPSSAEPQIEAPKPEPGSQTSDTGSGGLRPPLRKSAEPEFGGAARLRNLEGNIDKELEEAMGGISEKELYGDQGGSDSGGLRPPLSGQAGVDDK